MGNRQFGGVHEMWFVRTFGFVFYCVRGTKPSFFAYAGENSGVQPLLVNMTNPVGRMAYRHINSPTQNVQKLLFAMKSQSLLDVLTP